jgi:hypothetical protein
LSSNSSVSNASNHGALALLPLILNMLTFGHLVNVAKEVTGVGAAAPAIIAEPVTNGATKEDIAQAKTADEVADTAEKLDSNEANAAV